MVSSALRMALLGLVFLLLGGVLVFLGVDMERDSLLGTGIGSLVLSVLTFSFGIWLARRRPDPLDRRREQRLWKSGPLGRRWLQNRRRIP